MVFGVVVRKILHELQGDCLRAVQYIDDLFWRLMRSGSEGHILFSILIIGWWDSVSSFTYIVVMEAVTGEVVLPLLKVW